VNTPETAPRSPHAWTIVGVLFFAGLLNYLDRLVLITMRVSISADIPMSNTQFGLLTTALLFCYALFSPVGGYTADRFKRSHVIIGCLAAWSAATWLSGQATTFGELMLSRVLLGVSQAFYFPAAGALIADYHSERTRALANGIHLGGVILGAILVGFGGLIADRHGWPFAFELFGGLGMAWAVVAFFVLRDRPAAAPKADVEPAVGALAALRSLFQRWQYICLMIFWGLLALASWAFVGWMPAYLGERFGLAQGAAGLTMTSCFYGGCLAGMIVGGWMSDRWIRTNPLGRILVGMIGLAVAAFAVIAITLSGTLALTAGFLVVFGICRAFPDANMVPILCGLADARYRATGIGFLNALATSLGGVTIYVGGVIRDAELDITYLFLFGAGGLLVCLVLLWLIRPRGAVAAQP
jgi:predicted MFS family arabinose efflux permease